MCKQVLSNFVRHHQILLKMCVDFVNGRGRIFLAQCSTDQGLKSCHGTSYTRRNFEMLSWVRDALAIQTSTRPYMDEAKQVAIGLPYMQRHWYAMIIAVFKHFSLSFYNTCEGHTTNSYLSQGHYTFYSK